jgi:hypothetical protein
VTAVAAVYARRYMKEAKGILTKEQDAKFKPNAKARKNVPFVPLWRD